MRCNPFVQVAGSRRWSYTDGRSGPGELALPAERPTDPGDIVATIFHSLGLDLEAHLPGPAGRPFPLVDFGRREVKDLF